MAESEVSEVIDAQEAQDVLLCELCEFSTEIEWKCMDCELFMCDKCKQKIHSKIKATTNHNTVSTKNLGASEHVQHNENIQKVFCPTHLEHFYCLYCKTCCVLVCQDCISSSHSKHEFESIGKMMAENATTLRDCNKIVDDELCRIYADNTSKIDGFQQKYDEQCKVAINVIKHQEKEIKRTLKTVIENHLKSIEKRKSCIDAALLRERELNEHFHSLTQNTARNISDALACNNPEKLLNATKEVSNSLKTIQSPIVRPCNDEIAFECSDSDISPHLINEMLGSLRDAEDNTVKLKKAGTYNVSYKSIASIETTKYNRVYILDNDLCSSEKTVGYTSIDHSRKKIKPIKDYNEIDTCDIALTQSGNVLLYLVDSSEVKQLSTDGALTTHTKFHPLLVRGLHVTKYDEIIVGLRENAPLFPMTKDSIRQVVVFGSGGNRRKFYEYNEGGERLFSVPRKFATDSVRNIYVLDDFENEKSRIICLNAYRSTKWTYSGPSNSDFLVCDLITTDQGNPIVLTETEMFVLSPKGEAIKTFSCQNDIKICYPGCLDIDHEMNLWVGGSSLNNENRQILNKFIFSGF